MCWLEDLVLWHTEYLRMQIWHVPMKPAHNPTTSSIDAGDNSVLAPTIKWRTNERKETKINSREWLTFILQRAVVYHISEYVNNMGRANFRFCATNEHCGCCVDLPSFQERKTAFVYVLVPKCRSLKSTVFQFCVCSGVIAVNYLRTTTQNVIVCMCRSLSPSMCVCMCICDTCGWTSATTHKSAATLKEWMRCD